VLRWQALSPEYERRFAVLPGLTGLAQLSGCPDGEPEGKGCRIQYDLYYVDHRSLLLDIRILLRTARVVLGRRREEAIRLRHGAGGTREQHGSGVVRPARPGQRVDEEDGALAASGPSAVKGVTR
jgi:hypothetical protein